MNNIFCPKENKYIDIFQLKCASCISYNKNVDALLCLYKKCRMGTYTTNEVVTHSSLVCFGGFGQPRCKFLYVCTKENNMRFKEKCDSCGEKKFCKTVHISKEGDTERWCKKCRDEEERITIEGRL